MTEVSFHFNAPDKVGHACRLLRKAAAGGAQVAVTGDAALLRELDAALWTFSALDFVPHCLEADVPEPVRRRTPIVLVSSPLAASHRDVVVNLGDAVPQGFESFGRVIEVVTGDDADRQAARRRWKHYAERGYAIVRHDLQEAR